MEALFLILVAYLVFRIALYKFPKAQKPEDEHCPVCGYYCLGKGGHGCIHKPDLCGYKTKNPLKS